MLLHNLEVAEQNTKATTTAFYTWYILLFIELGVCSNEVRNCCVYSGLMKTNNISIYAHGFSVR
jgi:purine-nucleoside phosphorylase